MEPILFHKARRVDDSEVPEALRGRELLREAFPCEVSAVDDESRTITLRAVTKKPNRAGDVVEPRGGQFKNFRKNPIITWAHEYGEPWIGKATKIIVEDDYIDMEVEFAPPEVYAFADQIFRLIKWYKRAPASIGFIPIDVGDREEAQQAGATDPWGRLFKKWELLEVAIAPIPKDPGAVAKVIKAGILDEASVSKLFCEKIEDITVVDVDGDTRSCETIIEGSETDDTQTQHDGEKIPKLSEKVSALEARGLSDEQILEELSEQPEDDYATKDDIKAMIRVIRSVEKNLTGSVTDLARKQEALDTRLDDLVCEMQENGFELKDRKEQRGEVAPAGDPAALMKLRLDEMEIARNLEE